ncbi:hypothetical protein ACOI1H_20010 [Loktanella sp. DJP18]|uniref:hypothetical protein n=1 Tax=Loktanella sp. DJP18 TaxID=3409788 RepID=UPI003BB5C9CC
MTGLKYLCSILSIAALGLAISVGDVRADTASAAKKPIVINSDGGGKIQDRIDLLEHLRVSDTPVEIRGMICASSCTMYLGLPDVCISRNTRFGFHGPSLKGKPLSPELFEVWSQKMADWYPEPIKAWYLKTARFEIRKAYWMSGEKLIGYGFQECKGWKFAL